jgi:hypothetical protein
MVEGYTHTERGMRVMFVIYICVFFAGMLTTFT